LKTTTSEVMSHKFQLHLNRKHRHSLLNKDTSLGPLLVHDAVSTFSTSNWISRSDFIFMMAFCYSKHSQLDNHYEF